MAFHHPFRYRHYQPDPGEYAFALVRWTLNAIAVLIASTVIFTGFVLSSTIHWG